MKSTEHVSNEGTYASIQSQQALSRLVTSESTAAGKRNPKELIYVKQTATTAAGGHQVTTATKTPKPKPVTTIKSNSLDCERIKWNPSLGVGGQNTTVLKTNIASTVVETVHRKSKDWLLSAKPTLYPELSDKETRSIPTTTKTITNSTAAMSVTVNSEQHQQKQPIHVENVSKSKLNHSSDVKKVTTPETTLNFNERLKTEPKQLITSARPVNAAAQQKLLKFTTSSNSIAANKTNENNIHRRQINGNDEPAIATDNNTHESLHKSITNHSTVGNSSLSSNKQNDSGKGRKKLLSERRKLKEAKCIREKKQKCANGGGGKSVGAGRRSAAALAQHDATSLSSRLPVKCNENGTFDSAVMQQQQQPNDAERFSGKRMDKEWHSPESYIYDDISSDTIADSTEYNATCMQTFWFRDLPNENLLTREQRLENKRDNLRRQAFQYAQAQHFRSTMLAKRRFLTVTKALAKFKNERNK